MRISHEFATISETQGGSLFKVDGGQCQFSLKIPPGQIVVTFRQYGKEAITKGQVQCHLSGQIDV